MKNKTTAATAVLDAPKKRANSRARSARPSRRSGGGNRTQALAPMPGRPRRDGEDGELSPDEPVITMAGPMRPPRLYMATPGDPDSMSGGAHLQQRPVPHYSAEGGGFRGDLRTVLTVLSAHQGAVGKYTQRMAGRDVAKNEMKIFIDNVLAGLDDNEAVAKNSEAYQQAWEAKRSGDMKKMMALCELRKENINNYVRARSHFLEMFFEEQVLGQNDSSYVVNETMYPQAVFYMAQDGKLRLQRAIAAQSNFLVPLYFVSSEKYGYQIEDLQRGNITAPAMKTVDIAFDIAAQLDYNAFLLLTGQLTRASQNGGVNGVFGAFVTYLTSPSTAQQLLTFYPSSRIQASLLPTTNVLQPSPDPIPAGLSAGRLPGMLVDSAGNPVIGLSCAHAVIKYCDQFANVFMDGPLRPTGLLIVPAIDASSPLSQVTATAAKPSAVAEGLLSNYTRFEYGGIVWTMMPDVTIPRGSLYAVLNKPVGRNFVKPSFDREFVNTDFEANWEDRWYRKTQGLYAPVQWTPRAVQVQYQ